VRRKQSLMFIPEPTTKTLQVIYANVCFMLTLTLQ